MAEPLPRATTPEMIREFVEILRHCPVDEAYAITTTHAVGTVGGAALLLAEKLEARERDRGSVSPAGVMQILPHDFQGDPSRWCEICERPDRHPIHASAALARTVDERDKLKADLDAALLALKSVREREQHATGELFKSEAIQILGTHLEHCNAGEHLGACKYGDDYCPVLTKGWRWIAELRRAAAFGIHVEKLMRRFASLPYAGKADAGTIDVAIVNAVVEECVPAKYRSNGWRQSENIALERVRGAIRNTVEAVLAVEEAPTADA